MKRVCCSVIRYAVHNEQWNEKEVLQASFDFDLRLKLTGLWLGSSRYIWQWRTRDRDTSILQDKLLYSRKRVLDKHQISLEQDPIAVTLKPAGEYSRSARQSFGHNTERTRTACFTACFRIRFCTTFFRSIADTVVAVWAKSQRLRHNMSSTSDSQSIQ